MVTRKRKGASGASEWYVLSTDPMPTAAEKPANADPLYIMDTGEIYLYDEENDRWLPQ